MAFEGSGRETANITNLEIIGRFFYVVDPLKHMHEKPVEVPDYIVDVSRY